jgi:hypothetical protein
MLGTCHFKCKEINGRVFEWDVSAATWAGYCKPEVAIKEIVDWPEGPLPPPKVKPWYKLW